MSRAYTEEEMRTMFLEHTRGIISYWTDLVKKGESTYENAIEGVAFSMFTVFDGEDGSLPAMDVIPSPHPSDKKYHQKNGENYWVRKNIADGTLHEQILNQFKNL